MVAAAFLALALGGCRAASHSADVAGPGPLKVVATMSTLAALAQPVAGEAIAVRTLVPVGASPEDYQPTPDDIAALRNADVVIENGAGLETWLARTMANAKNPHAKVVTCSDGLKVIDGNPHLWMDPENARRYVANIQAGLSAADPAGAGGYAARARAYDLELRNLSARTRDKIASIDYTRRSMVVFHNAWEYYNRRFGIRTIGVIELSPGADPSPAYLAALVDKAKAAHVRAIFAEPEYSPKLVQAVARSAGIPTVAVLYDDSVGTDAATKTYIAMLDRDTDVIVASLR